MSSDTHYRVLRLLESRPEISQRQLAEELGVSLGKTNYCVKALIDKGWIKMRNFKNSDNKRAYLYKLTPAGVKEKSRAAANFLASKQAEYERLKTEIAELQREVAD